MGTRFDRFLGDAARLSAKEWSSETASGWPAYCCPSGCGHITEVNPVDIMGNGIVMRRRACANEACGFADYLEFGAYVDEVLS